MNISDFQPYTYFDVTRVDVPLLVIRESACGGTQAEAFGSPLWWLENSYPRNLPLGSCKANNKGVRG